MGIQINLGQSIQELQEKWCNHVEWTWYTHMQAVSSTMFTANMSIRSKVKHAHINDVYAMMW
jgi:hypothetical protein